MFFFGVETAGFGLNGGWLCKWAVSLINTGVFWSERRLGTFSAVTVFLNFKKIPNTEEDKKKPPRAQTMRLALFGP